MAEERRSAIGNERVGARLGRLFQRNRTQEERDILEAYRTQTPVDEIRRRRESAAPAGAARPQPRMGDAEGSDESAAASRQRPQIRMGDGEGSDEAAATLRQRQQQRQPRPNNARLAPRPTPARMSEADMLNQRELDRIGLERIRDAEREEEGRRLSAAAAQRAESMGGSGDIGAASARARGEQVGPPGDYNMKKGGVVKKMAKGGVVKKMAAGGASRRGDGCATRGKTKGRMV